MSAEDSVLAAERVEESRENEEGKDVQLPVIVAMYRLTSEFRIRNGRRLHPLL